ncbi:hypothetical protein Tco_0752064 [Tanacetum coccineum]|uniref:Uncharacterized protein n=1 Tax=Tanacetum coccineum TaxID=301880 RepID=A0ABQ4Z9G8_9ASTR
METDIVKLMVEIESFGMSSDEFDKETRSSDGLQPKQADLSSVHALNELHLHEICVVPSKHEADQYTRSDLPRGARRAAYGFLLTESFDKFSSMMLMPSLIAKGLTIKDSFCVGLLGGLSSVVRLMMDDPNITMEEYIKLQVEKSQRRGQTFNWETATYGKSYCDDLDFFTDFEADYPAIVYNDALTSNENVPSKPPVSIYNEIKADIDFSISFSDSDDEDYTFICDKNSFSYKLIHVNDLKPEPVNDHVEINTELCSENVDIKPMDSVVCICNNTTLVESDECLETNHNKKRELSEISNFITKVISRISFLEGKPLIFIIKTLYVPFGIPFDPKRFYKDGVYTLRRPRDQRHRYLRFEGLEYTDADIANFEERLGKIYGREGCLGFGEAVLHLDTVRALQFQLGRAKHRRTGLRVLGRSPTRGSECLLERISSEGDFLGTTPSYTVIRDQMLRLCHRLIACNITGRSQAPKKVTVTDLFYLRGMDVDSVNIPYLLARYLGRFTLRRKCRAIISGGQFVARLAEHFGLLTKERL